MQLAQSNLIPPQFSQSPQNSVPPPVSTPVTPPPLTQPYEPPKPKLKLSVVLSSLVVLLLIIAIPVGVYLTRQRQDLTPKADQVAPQTPKTSLLLEAERQATSSALVVNVYARSDIDAINLIAANLDYPKENLEVASIATSSAQLASGYKQINGKWILAEDNREDGQINLALGIPNPGFKTEVTDKTKYLLATVNFKVKSGGNIRIGVSQDKSIMLRNSDIFNILNEIKDLSATLAEVKDIASSSAALQTKVRDFPSLKLVSPLGGEVFAYFAPTDIKWDAQNIEKVTISLILNDVVYGNLASNITNTGSFSWRVQDTLPLTYINPNSAFQIKITGSSRDNLTTTAITPGYFGLVSQTDAKVINKPKLTIERVQADINNDNKVDYFDLSLLLSSFNKQKFEEGYDFNQDGVINIIDLWILRSAYLAEVKN